MAEQESTAITPLFQLRPEMDNATNRRTLSQICAKVSVCSSGCWVWTGKLEIGGYGIKHIGHTVRKRVHRLIFDLCVAHIPDGMLICHHCDNRPCCNPTHLFLGDEQANNRDCVAKGRHPELKLTDEHVLEIRRRATTGKKGMYPKLAREFGVSQVTISRVVRGDGHFHLDKNAGIVGFTDAQRIEAPTILKMMRAKKGINQKQLATLLGFANSYISRVESGKRVACNALLVAMDKLLTEGAA